MAAILASFRFAALFLPRGGPRWLALIVIAFGGGFGWLLVLVGLGNWPAPPIDMYIPEAYTFLMLYGLPHLALARAMLLIGMLLLGTRQDLRSALLAGAAWLVMALCVPFDVVVLYALLGAWGIALTIRCRRLPIRWAIRPAIAAIIPAPIALYSLIVVAQNPAFTIFNAQNKLPSPNPIQYLIGFGLLAIPAIFGVRWAWRRAGRQPLYALLIGWVIAAPLLAYVPVSVQRRLIEGIWVPLCVLAIAGLRLIIAPRLARYRFFRRRRIKTRRLWAYTVAGLLLLSLPTSALLLLTGAIATVSHLPPLYHTADELAALDWLNAHGAKGAVVLSSSATGNYLPARTHLIAFSGHGVETLHSDQKLIAVSDYYNGITSLADLQTPDEYPIQYIFYGPKEKALLTAQPDPTQSPTWTKGLTLVYQQGAYTIYATP